MNLTNNKRIIDEQLSQNDNKRYKKLNDIDDDLNSQSNNNESDSNNSVDDSNNIITSFIIIRPINNQNTSEFNNNSDGSSEDSNYNTEDEDEDEDVDEDERVEEEVNDDKNKNNKNNKYKVENIEYFNSSDSSDSENEFDAVNSKKFALNLLKKVKRHNSKDKPELIAKKFNDKIKKLDSKYKLYSKEPLKYKKIREFKKNIDECKELFNLLDDDILFYGTKFNFNLFYKKYSKNSNTEKDIGKNLLDLLFPLNKQQSIKNTSNSNNKLDKEFEELYEHENKTHHSGFKYFKTLDNNAKQDYIEKLKKVTKKADDMDKRPNYMKVLDMDMNESNKALILQRISMLENSTRYGGDSKLKTWINKIMKVPFGNYVKPLVSKNDPVPAIREYLSGIRQKLDNEIYGHEATKDQLVKILAHTITNPTEGGNIFALQGPPGVGKTALIQDGIAKALGRPFSFISLGGATDSCFLEGHDFTYEGSNHGRIIEVLQQSKCMNPVIYFDELDKVSETSKGEEIINILMHITDQTQNAHFNDKYFGGIDFDLSKAIIIFSFNSEQKVSHILRDRMKIIRVKGYKLIDKLNIAKNYLIPKLLKQIGINDLDINISDKVLEFLIDNYTNEGGVRKLKELLNDILLEINLRKLEGNKIGGKKIKSSIVISSDMIENDFLKKKRKMVHLEINKEPMVGIVNGLWANELGIGGLIPIECCWIPSAEKLSLELTGMQGDVMKESMSVARSVAWRILPEYMKSRLNEHWKTVFDYGIHIHCPDGATPKDGPSAGGAITTCLISLLSNIKVNNNIAMTGEINLKGHITAIGGLEEKIFGAKKAGATLVLCPRENSKDLEEIKDKFPKLFDDNFQAKLVDNIWDILNEVLLEKVEWIRFD